MLTFVKLKRYLLGAPLPNRMVSHEKLTKLKALAILSSDALSSVAYATEEILIPLMAFSMVAAGWSLPLSLCIILLLGILTLSYRQTIEAYPSGGGAYTVAKDNLGTYPGLIAAAALLIDYVLTVSVSISSGVANIVSAFPELAPWKVPLALTLVACLALLNLRGVRDSASIFAIPTYLFMFALFVLIVKGLYLAIFDEAHPLPSGPLLPEIPWFLVLRAFSSGCTALTGIEAISNGIPLFQDPAPKNAKTTLSVMVVFLGCGFLGLTFLSLHFSIVPSHQGETVISMLGSLVFSRGWMYFLLQGATALILILAANTSYADFPRLAFLLAKDRYLPRQLASRGDRLVFSNGVLGLSLAAMFLIYLFEANTHHLIPLYALGVFLSFSLSQGGMIVHHLRRRSPGWPLSLAFNVVGGLCTVVVLVMIATTKFALGAWMVLIAIPSLVFLFKRIHQHYLRVARELTLMGEVPPAQLKVLPQTVLIPVSGIHHGVLEALEYALSIASDVRAVHVQVDSKATERLLVDWNRWVPQIPLVVLDSEYRAVLGPLLAYMDSLEESLSMDRLTVVVPEFVPKHWYQQILHNQTALQLRTALLFRKGKVVTTVRYYLRRD
jgi:amino acid transporter